MKEVENVFLNDDGGDGDGEEERASLIQRMSKKA